MQSTPPIQRNGYPTSDGKPMAETDLHRNLMIQLIAVLQAWYADEPTTYVSGNLLLFYEENNRRRHVSPDVFVAFGVGNHLRPNYLLWEERAGPGVVIELTSSSTHRVDVHRKMELYRDTLRVAEYFLFDPMEDYLSPSLQGYRLTQGEYRPIRMQEGRLRSRRLGLLLERDGTQLRFVNPTTNERLPTPAEVRLASESALRSSEQARFYAETRADQEERERRLAEERAAQEERERRLAEERAAQEKRERRLAEERAAQEERERRLAEERIARLEREIEELRRRGTP